MFTVKNIFLALVCFLIIQNTHAQPDLRFQHFNESDGLPTSRLNSIVKDGAGFIWLGTADGLFRYDGYEFKAYLPSYDNTQPGDLASFFVETQLVDSQNQLWIGTFDGGLQRYRPHSDDFESLSLYDRQNPNHQGTRRINALTDDGQDQLLVATGYGVFFVNSQTGQFQHILVCQEVTPQCAGANDIRQVQRDAKGRIWLSNRTGELYQATLKSGAVTLEKADFYSGKVNTFYLDNNDQMYLALGNEIQHIDVNSIDGNRPNLHPPPIPLKGASNNAVITVIKEDARNRLWIGSERSGLFLLDKATRLLYQYRNDPIDTTSLYGGFISDILPDSKTHPQGVVWVLSKGSGLNRYEMDQEGSLRYFRARSEDTWSLNDNNILAITVTKDNDYWFATPQGLNLISNNTIYSKSFANENFQANCNVNDPILGMIDDAPNLLLAYGRSGIGQFNQASATMQCYPLQLDGAAKMVSTVFKDRSGKIWLGGYENIGVHRFDADTQQFTPLDLLIPRAGSAANDFPYQGNILALFEDRQGQLWVSGTKSLAIINKDRSRIESFVSGDDPFGLLANESVYAFTQDESGGLWFSTQSGIIQVSLNNSNHRRFSFDQGLISGNVRALVSDQAGGIWLGSPQGLSYFDTINETFQHFDANDGLLTGGISKLNYLNNGQLLVGGALGAMVVDSRALRLNAARAPLPSIYITKLLINNQLLETPSQQQIQLCQSVDHLGFFAFLNDDQSDACEAVLSENIETSQSISLDFDSRRLLSFQFTGLALGHSLDIEYRYKLEGFNDQWLETSAQNRFINYTGLPWGEYRLVIQGKGVNQNWPNDATAAKTLILIIYPPWYATYWGYGLFIGLLLLVIAGSYWLVHLDRVRLQRKVTEQTVKINQQKDKIETLLAQKNDLFANITHELRTPLTLIYNALFKLKGQHTDKKSQPLLISIEDNCHKLKATMDHYLELAKLTYLHQDQLRQAQPISEIVQHITLSMQPLAEDKRLKLSCDVDTKQAIWAAATPDSVQTIVKNLLSNAIKYTQTGGINVSVTECDDRVSIIVKDSGCGIDQQYLDAIFDRFTRIESIFTKNTQGSGIGLAMVKELVELQGGTIEVTSCPGQGSSFSVMLQRTDPILKASESLSNPRGDATLDIISPAFDAQSPKPQLFIIDDQAQIRRDLVELFADSYQCHIAADGQAALDQLSDINPDLVICDIKMPRKNGFEVCQAIKVNPASKHTPVVLLSALGDDQHLKQGYQAKADEVMIKPYDPELLKYKVANLLAHYRPSATVNASRTNVSRTSAYQQDPSFCQTLTKALSHHFHEPLTPTQLADAMELSPRQLRYKLKSLNMGTPSDQIKYFRIDQATRMLQLGKSVKTVSEACGYNDPGVFSDQFKAVIQMTPSNYRRQFGDAI